MAKEVINRLSNELSHLEAGFENAMRPVGTTEIQRTAQFVLNKIQTTNKNQYEAFLTSIGVPITTS